MFGFKPQPFWRDEDTDRELITGITRLTEHANLYANDPPDDMSQEDVATVIESCQDKIARLRNELQLRRER